MSEGSEAPAFDWGALAPLLIHPVKVLIIEAMHWIGRPLSASDLRKLFGTRFDHQLISYHLGRLAEVKAVEKVDERPSRGSVQILWSLA